MSLKKLKKLAKTKDKKIKRSFSFIKDTLIARKNLIAPIIVLALGLSLITSSMIFSRDIQTRSDVSIVKKNFSKVLLTVKADLENEFQKILENMQNDPINGLTMDKMPTAEEIFFTEWGNDCFPDVPIPLIGDYIESIGANLVGDIDLDGQGSKADLNISSHYNLSGIDQTQCKAIWNPQNENSLVTAYPSIWFRVSEGNNEDRGILKISFNLTDTQLNLVCNWIIISWNGWMKFLAQEEVFMLNPLLLTGLMIPGGALISYGVIKLGSEILKRRNINPKMVKNNKGSKSSNSKVNNTAN